MSQVEWRWGEREEWWTETNRAGVKRRGAEKGKGWKEWECKHDNDRESERGSVNEKADRKAWIHVEHKRRQTVPPPSLYVSISHSLHLSFFPHTFCHLSFYTALYFSLLFLFFFFLNHLRVLIFFFPVPPPLPNPRSLPLAPTSDFSFLSPSSSSYCLLLSTLILNPFNLKSNRCFFVLSLRRCFFSFLGKPHVQIFARGRRRLLLLRSYDSVVSV